MGAVYEKILDWKIDVKNSSWEMVALCEKILGRKINVKNSKMENRCEKLESVKILGWKINFKILVRKWKKNRMCVPGCTVEVKLLCNFSKIAKICNIFPNEGTLLNHEGTLLNHLSSARSYECDSFTDSRYTPVFPSIFLSAVFKTGIRNRFEKRPQSIWTRIAFDGELRRRITRISERIDFTPNKTKEVSLQLDWWMKLQMGWGMGNRIWDNMRPLNPCHQGWFGQASQDGTFAGSPLNFEMLWSPLCFLLRWG